MTAHTEVLTVPLPGCHESSGPGELTAQNRDAWRQVLGKLEVLMSLRDQSSQQHHAPEREVGVGLALRDRLETNRGLTFSDGFSKHRRSFLAAGHDEADQAEREIRLRRCVEERLAELQPGHRYLRVVLDDLPEERQCSIVSASTLERHRTRPRCRGIARWTAL